MPDEPTDLNDMICKRKNNVRAWLALTALVLALTALATPAGAQQYDVEVIMFTRDLPGGVGETRDRPGPAAGQPRRSSPAGEFSVLPADAYQLRNIRGALASASGYRVLLHRAWRQPAYDRANAADYPVYAEGGRERVEGSITLIRERYLHLDLDLLLTARGTGPSLYPDGSAGTPAYRLNEKRRIRSGELHYFDHPRFGLIVQVTPYTVPDEQSVPGDSEAPVPDDAGGEQEPVPDDDQLTR